MRIGKQDQSFTAIATSDAESVTVRGYDLCDELIGKINFTDLDCAVGCPRTGCLDGGLYLSV